MRFNTHNRTPKIETKKSLKIILTISFGLIISLFLFMAIVCSLYIESVMPAVVILTPVLVLAILIAISQKDMEKAFIEIVAAAVSSAANNNFYIVKVQTKLLKSVACLFVVDIGVFC